MSERAYKELLVENERLRTVLREISDHGSEYCHCENHQDESCCFAAGAWCEFCVAERALKTETIGKQLRWQGEVCKRCMRRNCIGFVVLDDVWNAVVHQRWAVLCTTCFDEEAQIQGVIYRFQEVSPISWGYEEEDK